MKPRTNSGTEPELPFPEIDMKRDTILSIKLPRGARLEDYAVREPRKFQKPSQPFTRKALAAAHVVADPLSTKEPWLEAAIDWDATLAYRRHLWSWGFGVAEAMDTAQRGMGSIGLLIAVDREVHQGCQDHCWRGVWSGAGTDHMSNPNLDGVIRAYEEQCGAIEKLGGRIILMASRALAACARSPDDYAKVYDRILSQVKQPVIIHWLGEMFDPALEGYWGDETTMPRWRSAFPSSTRMRRRWTNQDLVARRAEGDRHAPQATQRRAHVHRRRLQFRRADRGRCARLFGCAARHFRCHCARRFASACLFSK